MINVKADFFLHNKYEICKNFNFKLGNFKFQLHKLDITYFLEQCDAAAFGLEFCIDGIIRGNGEGLIIDGACSGKEDLSVIGSLILEETNNDDVISFDDFLSFSDSCQFLGWWAGLFQEPGNDVFSLSAS